MTRPSATKADVRGDRLASRARPAGRPTAHSRCGPEPSDDLHLTRLRDAQETGGPGTPDGPCTRGRPALGLRSLPRACRTPHGFLELRERLSDPAPEPGRFPAAATNVVPALLRRVGSSPPSHRRSLRAVTVSVRRGFRGTRSDLARGARSLYRCRPDGRVSGGGCRRGDRWKMMGSSLERLTRRRWRRPMGGH